MSDNESRLVELDQSTVLIVGGTAGIGRAAAHKYAAAGVPRIVLVGRNAERGETAVQSLRESAPDCAAMFISADANDPAEAARIADETVARFGSIDVMLCCTVGSAAPRLLKDTPLDELQAILVEQAIGPILMSRAVLPHMIEAKGGVILNVASDAAKLATPGESVIGGAMAAIVMFTRTLAMEAKREGVRVNALTPSLVVGTQTNERMMADPFAAKLFAKAGKMASLGMAEADDLADLALFLSSPAARKITGQAISANGGISAA